MIWHYGMVKEIYLNANLLMSDPAFPFNVSFHLITRMLSHIYPQLHKVQP